MSFLSSGHERALDFGARRIVCDELHVETTATGVVGGGGGGGAGSFTTLAVSGATTLGGALSSTANVTTTANMSCSALTSTSVSTTTVTAFGVTANQYNGLASGILTSTGRGAPDARAPGSVFPNIDVTIVASGLIVVNASSFAGEASNGVDPADPRGGAVSDVAAKITNVIGQDSQAKWWVFNNTPYTFYVAGFFFPGVNNLDASRSASGVWYPLTTLVLSRSNTGSFNYLRQLEPLHFVSNWAAHNVALLTSPDCTFDSFRSRYTVTAVNSGSGRADVHLTGALNIDFTKAGADPVRIQVPLPVGPTALAYGTVAEFTPRCGAFRDWVVGGYYMFNLDFSRPVWIGGGELARNDATTYTPEDATARVAVFVEPGALDVGYIRAVVSGFTGGAGSYRMRAQYDLVLDNIQFRPTYTTF